MTRPMTVLRLSAPGGIDVGSAVATLAAHTIPGAQSVDDAGTHRRALVLDGHPVPVEVRLAGPTVEVRAGTASPTLLAEVRRVVRFWFDLDRDLGPVNDHLARDPDLAALVRRRPALRTTRIPDGFEAAVMAVLGQQVSLARARALGGRLVAAYGRPGPAGLRLLPTADRVAAEPVDSLRAVLGLTGARARAVHGVAALFASGFDLGPDADPATARAALIAVPGVGPWTADYLAIRATAEPDAFPAADAVLRRATGGAGATALAARSARWSPWRSYAAGHLWASAAAPLRSTGAG